MFYEITPLDTLFFRGAEPMEAGQLAAAPLFPPPVSVLSGAIRTTVLKQKNIAFAAYNAGSVSQGIIDLVGKSGDETAPFAVTAVLVKYNNTVYAPAPYCWFVDTEKRPACGSGYENLAIIKAGNLRVKTLGRLKIKTSEMPLPVVSARKTAFSLGGAWLRYELLVRPGTVALENQDVLHAQELYAVENRTGISLLDDAGRSTRKVKEGALFTAGHIRLREGVSLVVGTDRDCGLADTGTMVLGGEQRLSGYKQISLTPLQLTSSDLHVTLAPVSATAENLKKCFCAGKLVVTAGWDLHKRFHKPSQSWFPAGSVFSENINNQCVPLAQ
ncbi:MAG: hypothetical protein JW795_23965 [Chitinivibrionales bacterium]|nr:hypothetical protein [Chitinivibrionales bacterium]